MALGVRASPLALALALPLALPGARASSWVAVAVAAAAGTHVAGLCLAALGASGLQQRLKMGRARQAAQDTLVRVWVRVRSRGWRSGRVRVRVRGRVRGKGRGRGRNLALALTQANQQSRFHRLPSRLAWLG